MQKREVRIPSCTNGGMMNYRSTFQAVWMAEWWIIIPHSKLYGWQNDASSFRVPSCTDGGMGYQSARTLCGQAQILLDCKRFLYKQSFCIPSCMDGGMIMIVRTEICRSRGEFALDHEAFCIRKNTITLYVTKRFQKLWGIFVLQLKHK